MYCRLLASAVRQLRDEPEDKPPSVLIELRIPTYIPKSYMPSDRQRMDAYRRIASATNVKDLKLFLEELDDMFGKVPTQIHTLADLAELRILASRWNIRSIILSDADIVFYFNEGASVTDLFARAPGRVAIPDK